MASPDLLPAYAELHCLSNFSFLRGASHPEELVERAKSQGYAALALTDECSLAGAVRAHLAAKDAGLPLILGSELTLADGMKLVLLATDRASYGDLSQLITRGRRNAAKGTLPADARRRRGARCDVPRAVAARARPARARGHATMRCESTPAGSRDVVRGPGVDRRRIACAGRRRRAARAIARACRTRADCRSSPQATCTCTCARAARCRTR